MNRFLSEGTTYMDEASEEMNCLAPSKQLGNNQNKSLLITEEWMVSDM